MNYMPALVIALAATIAGIPQLSSDETTHHVVVLQMIECGAKE
jgi:hypothetical protein